MGEREVIFFAYQGRAEGQADDNVNAITSAIREYNLHQGGYEARSWEEYKKTGTISAQVLAAIDQCAIFVSDLTYSNHNVLFELGYAIGKKKRILIFLNEQIEFSPDGNKQISAKKLYGDSFLKTVQYTSLTNSTSIMAALENRCYSDGLLEEFVNIANLERGRNDLLYPAFNQQVQHPRP